MVGMCRTVVVCLFEYFDTWLWTLLAGHPLSMSTTHLISSQNGRTSKPSYRDCSISMELVRTFAPFVSDALGAPLRPGYAHTGSHVQSGPSSLSGGGSIQTWLSVPSGLRGDWWKVPLQSPIAATCPFRAAATSINLRCSIAGVAEKKSSFSVQSLLVPARRPLGFPCSVVVHGVHPTSCQRSGGRIGAWHEFDDCIFDFREVLHVYSTCFSNSI